MVHGGKQKKGLARQQYLSTKHHMGLDTVQKPEEEEGKDPKIY
jgi:hypothetical protein